MGHADAMMGISSNISFDFGHKYWGFMGDINHQPQYRNLKQGTYPQDSVPCQGTVMEEFMDSSVMLPVIIMAPLLM